MLKTLLTATATTVLLVSAAFAAEVEGTVQTFDPTTKMVTLESGETFVIPDEALNLPIGTGTKVRIVYTDGTTEVEDISVL